MTSIRRFTAVDFVSEPGSPDKPSEDWVYTSPELIVVLDGATVRTETGCIHDVPWYVERLGTALVNRGQDPGTELVTVLAGAIRDVASQHGRCDLSHPGTPSAGVAVVRSDGSYLVLGDVSIVADVGESIAVIVDPRVEQTAQAERAEADRYLIGTAEKAAALIPMKRAELAARNTEGGYWIAASDPSAAYRALTGNLHPSHGARLAVMTDGAARITAFGLKGWSEILDYLVEQNAAKLVRSVRVAEGEDLFGSRWPRNKASDDATVAFAVWEECPGA